MDTKEPFSKPNPNTDSFIFINDNTNGPTIPNLTDEFTYVSSSAFILPQITPSSLANKISSIKDLAIRTSSKLRPWSEFFRFTKVSKPKNVSSLLSRVYHNIFYFQNNYIFLFLGLVAYCLFTNPLLLLIIGAWCLIWWVINYKTVDGEIKCAGHILGVKEITGISFFVSIPLLYFAGVGSMFFWLIGVTIVIVGIHASLLDYEEMDSIPMTELGNQV